VTREDAELFAIEASRHTAEVLVSGFEQCAAVGRPLTQLQQIELVACALQVHDQCTTRMLKVAGGVDFLDELRDLHQRTSLDGDA
jgi:hypothetical protein